MNLLSSVRSGESVPRSVRSANETPDMVALVADGRLVCLPRQVTCRLDRFLVGRLPALDLGLAGKARLDDPVAHAPDAVVFDLESQSFRRFVALVAAAGRVPLWLRQLGDVEEGRLVRGAHSLDPGRVGVDERRVVPSSYDVDVDARPVVRDEASERIGDRALRRLVADGHGNAISVVPHRQRDWDLQDARRVDRFPEMPFAGRRVTNGPESNLVAVDREAVLRGAELRVVAIQL